MHNNKAIAIVFILLIVQAAFMQVQINSQHRQIKSLIEAQSSMIATDRLHTESIGVLTESIALARKEAMGIYESRK